MNHSQPHNNVSLSESITSVLVLSKNQNEGREVNRKEPRTIFNFEPLFKALITSGAQALFVVESASSYMTNGIPFKLHESIIGVRTYLRTCNEECFNSQHFQIRTISAENNITQMVWFVSLSVTEVLQSLSITQSDFKLLSFIT